MNTVFNKMVSLILYLALSILITNKVFANECAAISFTPEIINEEEYVVVVRGDNGVSVMDLRKYREIVEGEFRYILSAGEHSLILDIWLKKDFSRMYRTWTGAFAVKLDVVNPKPELTKIIKVSVTADQFLQFSLSAPTINANFELTNQSSVKCNENKSNLIPSQLILDDEVVAKNPQLPEVLEYRLARLMADITGNTINVGNQVKAGITANISYVELDTSFGIILDDDNTNIKILTVLPNSLANNLGLASGDLIISMGGKPIEFNKYSANRLVAEYLQSLMLNDVIMMAVIRNNKSIQLKHKFVPLVFPEASYQIFNGAKQTEHLTRKAVLINSYTLPATLDYEFKQLRLAINSYFQAKKNTDGIVTINRTSSFEKNFGITGAITDDRKKNGFIIYTLEEQSSAAKLGLRKNDVILAIDNKALANLPIKELIYLLKNLTIGQHYAFKVMRDDQVKVLNGSYQPREFPGFSLAITLVSNERLATTFSSIKDMMGLGRRVRKPRGSFNGSLENKMPKDSKAVTRSIKQRTI